MKIKLIKQGQNLNKMNDLTQKSVKWKIKLKTKLLIE